MKNLKKTKKKKKHNIKRQHQSKSLFIPQPQHQQRLIKMVMLKLNHKQMVVMKVKLMKSVSEIYHSIQMKIQLENISALAVI